MKKKMNLANLQGKLSRLEMRNMMAGSGAGACTVEFGPICSRYTCPGVCFNPAPGLICCEY